ARGVVPHTRGVVPHTRGVVPYTRGVVPHTRGVVPYTRGVVPYTRGVVPHARDVVPHARDVVPHTRGARHSPTDARPIFDYIVYHCSRYKDRPTISHDHCCGRRSNESSDSPHDTEESLIFSSSDWPAWEARFEQFLTGEQFTHDPAHDLEHIRRVVTTAKALAAAERSDIAVVIPAAWLHDCVIVAKDSPLRSQASGLAAQAAVDFLRTIGYPAEYLDAIHHAIEAHSFSANIPPRTREAQVVQDADRLD